MRTLSLAQYARETGGTTDADVESHIHAGLRSVKPTKTYKKWFDNTLRVLQAKRDATREAYRAALEAGEIVAPEKPTLEEISTGEGAAAEAARRLIAKRNARRVAGCPMVMRCIGAFPTCPACLAVASPSSRDSQPNEATDTTKGK